MKGKDFSRRDFLKVGAGAAAGLMTASIIGCSGGGGGSVSTTSSASSSTVIGSFQDGIYQGQQGISAIYKVTDSTLYRQLLPTKFDMPDSLELLVCVVSYNNVNSPLVPYGEGIVALACKYQGQSGFYTLTMPVDDQNACDGGRSIGFPKYVADSIVLADNGGVWQGEVTYNSTLVIRMTFTPQSSAVNYDRSNPGPSFINLVPPGQGPTVYIAHFKGNQAVTSTAGSVTVVAGPNESWSGLLSGATLVSAQFDEISGSYTIEWGTEARAGVVSIARIVNGNIDQAVQEAIAMLGGIDAVTYGKQHIMLKPNLVTEDLRATTKPDVVRALASLMQGAGKDVTIGEGSACANGYNLINNTLYRTRNQTLLNNMQQYVFDTLGYTSLSQSLNIPLVNLHTGTMSSVSVPNGFAYQNLSINQSLADADMLCSIPMMKTHTLANVTLGIKNLMGAFPGSVYGTVRSLVHNQGVNLESSGAAPVVIDMMRVSKLGLVVVDASTAMEGDGPSNGDLVQMNLIIAGTNPLATDMVAANVMGFSPSEIPTFTWANLAGYQPRNLSQIEIRGASIGSVQRIFKRPQITTWNSVRDYFGAIEI